MATTRYPNPADYFDQYADAETAQQKYDRFDRDYHAPDRARVLAQMKWDLFNNDYHAPDRDSVLAALKKELDAANTGGGAGGNSGGGAAAAQASWMQYAQGLGHRPTSADAQAWAAAHPEFGGTLGGSKNNKYTIGGQTFKLISATSDPNAAEAQWLDITNGEGGGGQGYGFGDFAQGFDKQFKAPSIEEIRAMPGYKFALDEGLGAIDSGAAAHGTLLTGGNEKDRMQYGVGLADQFAQQKYQNAYNEYMGAYNIFRNNQNDVFGRFDRMADRGLGAANQATS